jgi:nucleotide-binding universal stress UspA family protein
LKNVFEQIILAVDASDHTRKAIRIAADIAKRYGSRVTVFHAVEHEYGELFESDTVEEAHYLVDEVVRGLKDEGIAARGEIRHTPVGEAAKAILGATEDERADLIVIGSRSGSNLHGLLIGSVAQEVVQSSDRPVLVSRESTSAQHQTIEPD